MFLLNVLEQSKYEPDALSIFLSTSLCRSAFILLIVDFMYFHIAAAAFSGYSLQGHNWPHEIKADISNADFCAT